MTLQNGNINDLSDQDLSYFISNKHFVREIQGRHFIFNLVNDMSYNIIYGDKQSMRFSFFKHLRFRNMYQQYQQMGSRLNTNTMIMQSKMDQIILLPSDPGDPVDQIKFFLF